MLKAIYVAPFAGAWIEMYKSFSKFKFFSSHPSRVRGLKLKKQENRIQF